MKSDFLRHEYTWSGHSISSNALGLGITASSDPNNKKQLRELEKIAGMAEPDSRYGNDVWLLMYSDVSGFVKLMVKPIEAAEDRRKNKLVYLYQCTDVNESDPAVYFIPNQVWKAGKNGFIPTVSLERTMPSMESILSKYSLINRLPEFFRAVFRCVFREVVNMNFVADWRYQDFAKNSDEIMFAIHELLPSSLRKNAGYASYGYGMNQCSSFYFSKEVLGDKFFYLEQSEEKREESDMLTDFFCENMAILYLEQYPLYESFLQKIEEYMETRKVPKSDFSKIQWIFLDFCITHGRKIPVRDALLSYFPQLFYWSKEEPELDRICKRIRLKIHGEKWSKEALIRYKDILLEGMTKKAESYIVDELSWILSALGKTDTGMQSQCLLDIRQKNARLYTLVMTQNVGKEYSFGEACLQNALDDFDTMKEYLEGMKPEVIPDQIKDRIMQQGIQLLNDDMSGLSNFETLTEIAAFLNRESQWIKILKGFVKKLEDKKEDLDEEQLDLACQIEKLLYHLSKNKRQGVLQKEQEKRAKSKQIIQEEDNDSMDFQEKEQALPAESIEVKETDEHQFLEFIFQGLPYGFLTGCVIFMINYSIVIGHWKIALGMFGMWSILIMNYVNILLGQKVRYYLWKAIGLCVIEGYIIHIISWLFLPKKFRIFFFILLGTITVVLQIFTMIYNKRKISKS